jgi:anti-sigma B factor antagonist
MTIKERQIGLVVVLDLQGPLAGRDSAEAVLTAVKRCARQGARAVVANLAGVASIDLSGLGALLDASQAMRSADGSLTLTGVTRRINDLLVITRLLTVFDTYDTVEDAAAAITGITRQPEEVTSAATLGSVTRFLRRAQAR